MAIEYKQKCTRCKTNFVVVTRRTLYPVCDECQKATLSKEITDPEMKKFFNIPPEFYEQNYFLKSIKIGYLKFGSLTGR